MPPTILKPKQLWTGKQVDNEDYNHSIDPLTILNLLHEIVVKVISTVLGHLVGVLPGLNLDSTNKIKQKQWRSNKDSFDNAFSEQFVLFRDNELLRGVLDKR